MMRSSLMRLRARRTSSLLSGHMRPNSTVLDLGCGDGSVSRSLACRLPLRITGADVVLQKETHIPVVRYSGSTLPFGDRSFDTVLLVWVLHHTEQPEDILREAARVCRKDILVLECYFTRPSQRGLLRLLDYLENRPVGIPVPMNFRTIPEWRRTFKKAGLETVSEHTGFRVHWLDPSRNVLFVLRPVDL